MPLVWQSLRDIRRHAEMSQSHIEQEYMQCVQVVEEMRDTLQCLNALLDV